MKNIGRRVRSALCACLLIGVFPVALTVTNAGAHSGSDTANILIPDGSYNLSLKTDKLMYFEDQLVGISGQLTCNGAGISGSIHLTIHDPFQILVYNSTVTASSNGSYQDSYPIPHQAQLGTYIVNAVEETFQVSNSTQFHVASSTVTVDAGGPYTAYYGDPILFQGTASGGVPWYRWKWEFGDEANASIQNPTHIYAFPGNYTVTLTVTDSCEHNGTDTAQVTVLQRPPQKHTVLLEEGTGTFCMNCPAVARILRDLYESGDYNFYYLALVSDKNPLAHDRLSNDYNISAYPTTFIDGGYEVIFGRIPPQAAYISAILNATNRTIPALNITIKASWFDDNETLSTSVRVHNDEPIAYSGRLRVPLTEIVSRWNDYNGDPYHFGFLQYLLDSPLEIPAGGTVTVSNITSLPGIDPENLMVIASVYNNSIHCGYAEPPSEHRFDAHYVDATVGIRVSQGNLPPEVGIINLKAGKLHVFGHPLFSLLSGRTVLLGKTPVHITATDDIEVANVEVFIDGRVVANLTSEPYSWNWTTLTMGKHTLQVKAVDDEGKSSTVSLDVVCLIF